MPGTLSEKDRMAQALRWLRSHHHRLTLERKSLEGRLETLRAEIERIAAEIERAESRWRSPPG